MGGEHAPRNDSDDDTRVERRALHMRTSRRYPAATPLEDIKGLLAPVTDLVQGAWPEETPAWVQEPVAVATLSALAAVGLTLGGVRVYRRFFKRIRNSDSVTSKLIDRQPYITGVVTRVGDGDNFRLYHTPGLFWRYPFKLRSVPTAGKDLKNNTLSIRIAGVDAPENAHFGNPAQPHAKESLEWLQRFATGKRVKVQLLRKDQYNRIVGIPYLKRTLLPNIPFPTTMLKEGMATVYTSGGAEFGPWGLDKLRSIEAEAQRARRGMWGARKVELPKDYKKRLKGEEGEAQLNLGKKASWWETLGRWLGGKT